MLPGIRDTWKRNVGRGYRTVPRILFCFCSFGGLSMLQKCFYQVLSCGGIYVHVFLSFFCLNRLGGSSETRQDCFYSVLHYVWEFRLIFPHPLTLCTSCTVIVEKHKEFDEFMNFFSLHQIEAYFGRHDTLSSHVPFIVPHTNSNLS